MSNQYLISQPIKIPFTSQGLATGLTTFTPIVLVNGSIPDSMPTFTYTEIGSGIYTINFAPNVSGKWAIFIGESLQLQFEVVSKDFATYLKNLEDQALGSWMWDKTTGVLTLLRNDSTTLATYQVADTLEAASRERVS